MRRRGKLVVAVAIVVAMSACASEPSPDSETAASVIAPGGDATETTAVDGTISTVSEGTLVLPRGASSDVVVATFRDGDNNRCIEVGDPLGQSGVCYDDEPDGLSYVTRPTDGTGAVYVFGGIELPEASAVVAVLPNGDQVAIPVVRIDGWPERAFVALFEEPPTRLDATDASGQVIASATN